MVAVYYGILGSTTAHHPDGTPVPLGGARLRALLAALVLRQGRPVPADLLVDEVWEAEPPQDSAAALQTLVGRLRRTIGREQVGSGPAGYWLTSERTDLGEFQRLTAEGRQALDAADHTRAAERLRAALALWRGPALADLPDRTGPAARLEAQRDEAVKHRITAELALGRAGELAGELTELCEARPLDEQLRALLIRALREGGRAGEALQQYESLRRALADQLGTDPSPQLQQLHRELLEPAAPAPQPTPKPVGNLRPRLTSFVGRDVELAALRHALSANRLTTLTGPGGSGKTRLAVEAGRLGQSGEGWPGGVWLAELAPLEDPAAVPGAVVTALGLRELVLHSGGAVAEAARNDDPVRRLIEHCAHRRMLLVLDNCEHLIQAAADLAEQLLTECQELTILATSREPLGVHGEAVLPVEPLADPAALRLFAERGAAARSGFDPAADPEACAEICRRLDGRFALLTAGARTLLPRQQTLRAVVDWSWDLLGKRERAVLRRLSVFAGGWTMEAAEQVCVDEAEVPVEEVADLLLSLVDKSLVLAELGGEPRYSMLETIHEYATERLAEAAEEEAVGRRHVRFVGELVRTAHPKLYGAEQLHWMAVLEREQDNIRAALRRAIDGGQEQQALALALGMFWFWSVRDYRGEAHTWYSAAARLGPDPYADDAPAPVPLLADPVDEPLPWDEPMLYEARRQVRLHLLVNMFAGNMDQLGTDEPLKLARRVLRRYTPELPQGYRLPGMLRVFASFLSGDMDGLRGLVNEAVAGCRVHGRPRDLAFILQIRARLFNDWVGELQQAIADSEEALQLFTGLGDRWGMSEALSARAENAAKSGDLRRAAQAYRRSIELAEEIGAGQEIPMLRIRLGESLLQSEPAEAERMIRDALAELAVDNRTGDGAQLFGRMVLANLHSSRGEFAEAMWQLDELQRHQGSFGPLVPEIFRGVIDTMRGWVLAKSGDPQAGYRLVLGSRAQFRSVDPMATVFAQHMTVMLIMPISGVLVELARQAGDPRDARRAAVLLGAYRLHHGQPGSYLERLEEQNIERSLRELLGPEGLAGAMAEGGRLTLEETAALLDQAD